MSSNKSTNKKRTAAPLQEQPRRQTRSKTHRDRNAHCCDIFLIVLQQEEKVLHWSDGVALSRTCKDAHSLWKQHAEDEYFLPLLQELDEMVGHAGEDEDEERRDEMCLRALLLDANYPTFSVAQKCRQLVLLLQTIVGNMQNGSDRWGRRRFCLEDPSNPAWYDISDWTMDRGFEMQQRFLDINYRRSALALNIAIFTFALSAMQGGGDYFFNDVFLDKPNASLDGGFFFDDVICSSLERMLPLRNEDLAKHIRAAYPTSKTLDILGPLLTNKVVLMAPFFRWVPPVVAGGDNSNVVDYLDDLPTSLEPMNETVIRSYGMERYLEPHDGIDY